MTCIISITSFLESIGLLSKQTLQSSQMEETMNALSNEECVVNGTLSLTLRLCRYAGVAPLHFVPLRNGYRISVSYYYAIYSYILITAIHIIGLSALLMDLVKRISFITWEHVFYVLAVLTIIVLCSRGSYCGVRRMKKMIAHLKCLEEITTVGKDNRVKQTHTARTTMLIFHVCIIIILLLGQLKLDWNNLRKNPVNICFWPLYLELITIFILKAQVILMFLEIQSSLETIKNKMDEFLSVTTSVTPPSSMFLHNMRSLTRAYVTACDVVFEVNNEDGIIILLAVLYLTARVINISCSLVSSLFNPSENAYNFMVLVWCILSGLDFLAFIESFNLITKEVTHIKVRLSKLMYKVTAVGRRVPIELQLMYKQLNLNKMTISPLSIFTVDRTLTMRILSGVITYFLFIIQVK